VNLPKGEAESDTWHDLDTGATRLVLSYSLCILDWEILQNKTVSDDLVAIFCVDFGFDGFDRFLPLFARLDRNRVLEISSQSRQPKNMLTTEG
jgi:hypothetical protein